MRVRVRLLALVAVLALAAAACGDDDSTEPAPETSGADDTVRSTVATTVSPTTAVAAADVEVASSSLGDILVDAEGMTLYVFLDDSPGQSVCVDACAQTWPPVVVDRVSVGPGLQEDDFTLISRPDGTSQLAVRDRPLYRFAGDVEPGDTAGQGFNDAWYVVAPDGEPVGTG